MGSNISLPVRREDATLIGGGVVVGFALATAWGRLRAPQMDQSSAKVFSDVEAVPYAPPSWARPLNPPKKRLLLANLPTPLERWHLDGIDGINGNDEVWIKRDDLTGMEVSGNKIRKLEFLLAQAKAEGKNAVITIGGEQSNHCRATAAAARKVGLEPHIILRVKDPKKGLGMTGNLLLDKIVDAVIHPVDASKDPNELLEQKKQELEHKGLKPFTFPSGGSNSRGSWGYIQMVVELEAQMAAAGMTQPFDCIYFSCGSGGTGAGLALGVEYQKDAGALSTPVAKRVVGLGVDDTPEDFYNKLDHKIFPGMDIKGGPRKKAAAMLEIVQSKGLGYAQSTSEELNFIASVAKKTGVVLDPVYSGKGAMGFVNHMKNRPAAERDSPSRVLFVHTGGLLGLYAKADQLSEVLSHRDN